MSWDYKQAIEDYQTYTKTKYEQTQLKKGVAGVAFVHYTMFAEWLAELVNCPHDTLNEIIESEFHIQCWRCKFIRRKDGNFMKVAQISRNRLYDKPNLFYEEQSSVNRREVA